MRERFRRGPAVAEAAGRPAPAAPAPRPGLSAVPWLARPARLLSRGIVHVVVIGLCLAWILPTVGLLVSSVRPAHHVARSGWWTIFADLFNPANYTLANYRHVLSTQGMWQSFLDSFLVAVPGTLLPMAIAAFAAFAFAWLPMKGRGFWFALVVALLVVPLQMTLIPILRVYNNIGLAGTLPGIWLAHTGYGLPFAIYLLRNFFASLPKELFEAAAIDGASPLGAFFRLALPMSVPALASLGIFQFLWVWNDLLVALIYLGGARRRDAAHAEIEQLGRFVRAGMARVDGSRLRDHGRAAHRVLRAAALLRPWNPRGGGEGVRCDGCIGHGPRGRTVCTTESWGTGRRPPSSGRTWPCGGFVCPVLTERRFLLRLWTRGGAGS